MHSILNPILKFIHGDGLTILPQLELLLFAAGILVFDRLLEANEKRFNAYLAMAGVVASSLGLYMQYKRFDTTYSNPASNASVLGFHDRLVVDSFSLFFSILALASAALAILLSVHYLEAQQKENSKYYSLLLLACIATLVMASALDLVVFFTALEVLAFCVFLLAGKHRNGRPPAPFALDYLLPTLVSSAILLTGFVLLYRAATSTNIISIGEILDRRLLYTRSHGLTDWQMLIAFACISAGIYFKLAVPPFHTRRESVTAPVSAFVAAACFTAGFAMFLRLLVTLFSASELAWMPVLSTAAIFLIASGTLGSLVQNNLFRMLACCSTAQVGYLLLGIVAWNERGFVGTFYSLLAFPFMALGAFLICMVVSKCKKSEGDFRTLDGLYYHNPAMAILLLLFVFSLAGVPPTAGFVGKYLIVKGLRMEHHPVLAAAAALFILPAAYNAVRIARRAWDKRLPAPRFPGGSSEPDACRPAPALAIGNAELFALIFTGFVTLAAGTYPAPFTHLVRFALGLTNALGR